MQFLNRKVSHKVVACIATALSLTAQSVAMAQTVPEGGVEYQQDGVLSEQLNIPIYQWSAPQAAQKGIVLAIHGVAMHGKSFDCLGRNLALQGYHVFATDMRGYGRSVDDKDHQCKVANCRHKVDYQKSFAEVTRLAKAVRERYPSLPIFGLGESLGTHMVIRLSAEHPELVDGLVLSAPSVRRHTMFDPYVVMNTGLVMTNPLAQLDLMPFVRKYASDDPRVIAEMEGDPLLRRRMNAIDLLKATKVIRKTISYVPKIPSETPVLVIQGGADKVLHADAVVTLLSHLHAKDQTVKWFDQRGHILLETGYVKRDTMDAVVSWLNAHADSAELQTRRHHAQDYVASHVDGDGPVQQASFSVRLPQEAKD